MILFIDSITNNQLTLALILGKKVVAQQTVLGGGVSEKFLPSLNLFLKNQKIKTTTIKKIVVAVGPGGFSHTRIAVAVANTLAFAWRVPVAAVSTGLDSTQLINELSRLKLNKIVVPIYKYPAV
ncbi:MAG: tRNA (adenosine(37)-N6)-threonylcarbamoyltransferase complex dimerization subunit type 1 TsaB [Patescibacteria group bacterium]